MSTSLGPAISRAVIKLGLFIALTQVLLTLRSLMLAELGKALFKPTANRVEVRLNLSQLGEGQFYLELPMSKQFMTMDMLSSL